MNKEIYIIRHGQTDFNVQGIVQGRGINSNINTVGQQQAKLFYEKYAHINFDVIYTSTLKRTHQTLAPFLEHKIEHQQHTAIDEIDWGIFEGVAHDNSLQEQYYDIIQKWSEGELDIKIEGGESASDLQKRLLPFVEEIKNNNFEKILICTHGRTLRALMCLLLNQPISKMDTFEHNNTCLYHLKIDNNKIELLAENDISHLNN